MNEPENRDEPILEWIVRKSGMPNMLPYLIRISPKEFQSVLLYVFRDRARMRTAQELLDAYQDRYRYLGISELDQREFLRFDSLFYSVVPKEFEAVELSPIGPLGTNTVLAHTSQHNVLSAVRNAEVVSDPTTMLALEAALRRKALLAKDPKNTERVRLCTSKRLLRLQPFDDSVGYMQHFGCFGMGTAGRDTGHRYFLMETAQEHIKVYLDFIEALNGHGFSIRDVTVYFSDIRIIEQLITYEGVDREVIMRNTQNPDFKWFEEYDIQLPTIIESCNFNPEAVDHYRIGRNQELLMRVEKFVLEPLRGKFPWVRFGFDLARTAGIGHYTNFCFHLYGTNEEGFTLPLADGGLTDWTKKLLRNKKELFMASGFGAELVHKMFRRTTAP